LILYKNVVAARSTIVSKSEEVVRIED